MISDNRFKSKLAGVTLIELLVTLFILTIGVAAIVKFQTYYFYYADLSRQQSEAVLLARMQMASLRNFQVLTTTSGYTAYADIATGSSSSTVNNTSYATSWTITTNTNPSYKTVNITVTWTDRRNNSKSVNLTSIIASVDPATSGVLVYG